MHPPSYQELIAQQSGHDPRLIEHLMRITHSTLDALSLAEFKYEIRMAEALIREVGTETAKRFAGLPA